MANGKKTDQQRIAATERRIKVLSLRKAGAPYRQIADTLAVSLATVHDDLQRAYAELNEQQQVEAAELRTLEAARLDDLTVEATRILKTTHPFVSGGKVLSGFTAEGKAIGLTDDGPKLAAIDRLLKIAERRARLLGLDAPTAVNVGGALTAPDYVALRAVVLQLLPGEQRLLLAEALDQVIDVTHSADSRSSDGARPGADDDRGGPEAG
jgi:DNA-binding CsgD family transcriptional regulator